MEYFVVMQDYGDNGLEAVVDPALTRSEIIARIKSRELDNIVQIDRIQWDAGHGAAPERVVVDVTRHLIDAAEAELASEPDGDPPPLPETMLRPVR